MFSDHFCMRICCFLSHFWGYKNLIFYSFSKYCKLSHWNIKYTMQPHRSSFCFPEDNNELFISYSWIKFLTDNERRLLKRTGAHKKYLLKSELHEYVTIFFSLTQGNNQKQNRPLDSPWKVSWRACAAGNNSSWLWRK